MASDIPPIGSGGVTGYGSKSNPWAANYGTDANPYLSSPSFAAYLARGSIPVADLNATSTAISAIQQQCAAGGDVLPICYGRVRIGAMVAGVTTYNGNLIVLALWAEGEIDAVESIFVNDDLTIFRGGITAIEVASIPKVTIPGHSLPEGTLITFSGVGGMTQINGLSAHIHIVDVDTVSLNDLGTNTFSTYTGGGTAQATLLPGVTGTHYTGTATQGVDPTLAAAYGVTYADTLAGVAYSVFTVTPGANAGFPRFVAQLRGMKVPLTSGGTPTFSENAAFIIADVIVNATHGMNRLVNWTDAAALAAVNDALIGSPAEPRRRLGLVLDSAQPGETWLNQLRDYAGCWIVPEGNVYRLIADAAPAAGSPKTITAIPQALQPSVTATAHGLTEGAIVTVAGVLGMTQINSLVSVVHVVDANHVQLMGINSTTFTAYSSGGTLTQGGSSTKSFGTTNIVADSLSWGLRSTIQAPTVVETKFTNRNVTPWAEDTSPARDPRVAAGTIPRRASIIDRPGITRGTEAYRYSVERLNNGLLCDMTVNFVAFDEALAVQVGDLVDITHPCGITAKLFRVMSCVLTGPGRWALACLEYDPAVYSNVVVNVPSSGNTVTPDPSRPPAVAGLTVTEDVFQVGTGYFGSRLRVTWSGPASTFPFVQSYLIEIRQAGVLIDSATVGVQTLAYVSKQLPENLLYSVTVSIVSTINALGTSGTAATITNNGKLAKPGDVPSITGYCMGGEVRLTWLPAVDLDLTGYELRYSSTGGSWASSTLLDRVATPSVTYTSTALPIGTWRLWIKALDSVRSATYPFGQQSVNAVYVDVAVSASPTVFLGGASPAAVGTLTNMVAYGSGYVTNFAASTWNSVFTSNLNTYANPLTTYHAGGTSSLLTTAFDYGVIDTAQVIWDPTTIDIGGAGITARVETSRDNVSWTPQAGLSFVGLFRYVRGFLSTTGTMAVVI